MKLSKISARYKKTDDRRNQRYGKAVEIDAWIEDFGIDDENIGGPSMTTMVQQELQNTLTLPKQAKVALPKQAKVDVHGIGYSRNRSVMARIMLYVEADRPKSVASDEEVRAMLPSDDEIQKAVTQAIETAQRLVAGYQQERADRQQHGVGAVQERPWLKRSTR